jgi:hypothetical protein
MECKDKKKEMMSGLIVFHDSYTLHTSAVYLRSYLNQIFIRSILMNATITAFDNIIDTTAVEGEITVQAPVVDLEVVRATELRVVGGGAAFCW